MNLLVKNDDVCRDGVCVDAVVVDLILLFSTANPASSSMFSFLFVSYSVPATLDAVLGTLLFVSPGASVARLRSVYSIDFLQKWKQEKIKHTHTEKYEHKSSKEMTKRHIAWHRSK